MKRILTILFLTTSICFSQEKVTSEVGDFNELKVFNGLDVILRKGETSKIEITGNKADEVVYKNVNNRLKLSMRFPETFNADEVDVVLYFTDELKLIDANEGSHITSKHVFTQNSIDLKAQEGAFINVELDVKYLTVKSVTGGHVNTSGKATHQDVDANSGASYKGYDLDTERSVVVSSSGAYVQVNVTELLTAKVRFGGTIYYKGNPEEIDQDKFAGGTISSKN